MRTVLILSPHFPPSTLAGVHRARLLAKALPRHGWRAVVVRAHPRHYSEPGDPALARLVPEEVEQLATEAVSARLGRCIGIGDIGLRAYPYFPRALAGAAERADVVLITGAPFYPLLLAGFVRQRLKLPVVLDFQDPWVSDDGARKPVLSKAGLSHRLARLLEPYAVRHASFITSVSERQNIEMAARYPFLDPARMAAIPIGGDPDDFLALRRDPPASMLHPLDPERINISYVGTFLPRAQGTMAALLGALARLRAQKPELASRVKLNFVGTSNQPGATGEGPVTPLARAAGVADLVNETARRVPFLEALALLVGSQGILMIGSDEPHYTASKIYPGLMSGTPYLSLFHEASSAHEILSKAGGGAAFAFANAHSLSALDGPITAALARLASAPESFGRADPASYTAYTADRVAAAFSDVFCEAQHVATLRSRSQ